MKYLEYESLEGINTALSCVDTGDMRVFGRLEAYSCKNTSDDKKLKQHIEHKKYDELEVGSPDGHAFSLRSPVSPFGPLGQPTSRKTLFYLLATLNAAFPDYDFSDIKPESFVKIPSMGLVANHINSTLFAMGNEEFAQAVNSKIWLTVDEIVQMKECDIYSFAPDPEVEPDSEEGNLWSFYYFFFNRKMKRVVFFTARAVSFMAPGRSTDLLEPSTSFIMDEDIGSDLGYDGFDSNQSLSFEQHTMQTMEV
ncbi:RNA polymerase III-inhibiting protein maf1 [Dinochytrium kinnereticum]|nr:RNA polymerase III-inhibiting protein maf1 [Dinochytrium kinnereticum]